MQRSPSKSAVRHAAALRISDRTVLPILHKDLKFHPYKIQVAQQLKRQDRVSQLDFPMEFGGILQETDNVLNNLFMSDEAYFHLNGFNSKQNFRYCGHKNPMRPHEWPLHCGKVTVWCAVSATLIIGPYFSKLEMSELLR